MRSAKSAAVIAEYNPFHNGHAYQLAEIRRTHEYVTVIMSGAFVERGDAAILGKRTRTQAALAHGADLVLELPTVFALNTAERFAWGAVSILARLGVCDTLFFGAENPDVKRLTRAAATLNNEPPEVSAEIKRLLSEGVGYAAARERAYAGLIEPELLREPNNILGIEYIKALQSLGSEITPVAIERTAGHGAAAHSGRYASATYIRGLYRSGGDISPFVPEDIAAAFSDDAVPKYDIRALDGAVTAFLRSADPEYIAQFDGMGEGLQNRIKAAARSEWTIEGICEAAATKRYTKSRIRRAVLAAFLGLTPDLARTAPEYARVLGANRRGFELIRQIKQGSDIAVITKAADFAPNAMFELDVRAGDIAALCASVGEYRRAGRDFTDFPVIVQSSK